MNEFNFETFATEALAQGEPAGRRNGSAPA